MGHTPGPWSANGCDIMCDANYCVAVAYRARTDDEGNWMPSAEVEANAALIQAAPELLAALRAVKAEFIDMYEECYPNDESDNDVTAAIDMAIAAIAKAEGRSE